MDSDFKRIIVAGALAAGAFNAAALSGHGAAVRNSPAAVVSSADTPPPFSTHIRPSRIRIERCGARAAGYDGINLFGPLTTI